MPALELFEEYFECGKIFVNKRYDNHSEHLYRYCVRSIKDLQEKVIPFFREHRLRTAKQKDFEIFTRVVKMIVDKQHLTQLGLRAIAREIERMNRKKKSQFLESSETTRRAPAKVG